MSLQQPGSPKPILLQSAPFPGAGFYASPCWISCSSPSLPRCFQVTTLLWSILTALLSLASSEKLRRCALSQLWMKVLTRTDPWLYPVALCRLPASSWSVALTTTSELDHPSSSFPTYLPIRPHCSISLVPCGIRALRSAGASWVLLGHLYRGTATKRHKKHAGPVTCCGNAFTGASSDASSRFIKLWTYLNQSYVFVCLVPLEKSI